MSEPSLPDLLETLGEVFLVPGAFDRARFEGLGEASWAGMGITPALQTLLITENTQDLDVAYAGLFLVGQDRPTLHLEASAVLTGSLADPEILSELSKISSEAEVRPKPSIQPDHLGAMLVLLAQLLRNMASRKMKRVVRLERASQILLRRFIKPLADRAATGLDEPGVHPFYRAAGRLLTGTVSLSEKVLL